MTYRDAVASLVVQDVMEKDTGRYMCEATNKYGSVSTSAIVRVKGMNNDRI